MKTMKDCIFCKIVAGEIPCTKVYEDDVTLSFMDIRPLNKGHLLVVPKEHYGTILEAGRRSVRHLYAVVNRMCKAVCRGAES